MRHPPWLCYRCGYMMDASTHMGKGDARPVEGDVSACINCGAPFVFHGSRWAPMTAAERVELDAKTRGKLAMLEVARRHVVRVDLSRKDKKA